MIFGYCINFKDASSLNLRGCDASTSRTIDVKLSILPYFEIYTEYIPHSLQEVRYGSHKPFLETKGKSVEWIMEVKNLLKLVWFPSSQIIGYEMSKACTPERLRFWLYHTFLPLLLQMEGIYHILHAGCVEVGGKAVVFTAPSFGGKSTLTDYFLKHGHKLLSDDTLAIMQTDEGGFRAVASWPFHRPYREPETLGMETAQFVTKPLEIAAVFQLEKTEENAPVKVKEIRGIEKFKTMHKAAFMPLPFLKDETFAFHTAFAKAVVLKKITVPWKPVRLNEVYETIVSEVI